MLNFPTHCAICGDTWFINHECRQNRGMPQTSKEKQEAFRARNAMLGMTEVRGIYLSPDKHAELKKMARQLQERAGHIPKSGK